MTKAGCRIESGMTGYAYSIEKPDDFWRDVAQRLDWIEPFITTFSGDMAKGDIRWFEQGKLNVTLSCIDRHLAKHGEKTAILWVGDEPGVERRISFNQLYESVCRFANLLKSRGIKKGDRVCIYMPMIPEAAFAMLACARIGAIHSVVFAGFSADALKSRILDADCHCVITADVGQRGGKTVAIKTAVDEALQVCDNVHSVIVVKQSDQCEWVADRDVDYYQAVQQMDVDCPPEVMDAEDPLFILYTSGSTGKPKGVLHTTAGYLLYASFTHQEIFDLKDDDVYWCTADVGWITGHSYIVYGPLCNATTTVMFEGIPTYPTSERCWQIVDDYQVSIFYTAPTAIRALMCSGDQPLQSTQRDSLRILGTVGEPINPEAWQWYHDKVGNGRCRVIDTWWQTETGGAMIVPMTDEIIPGAAMNPFYGVAPALLDNEGVEITGAHEGYLVVKKPWPGMMRSVYGDHQRFIDTYLTQFPGCYCTGDGAKRDEQGNYTITGRVDDVLNVSGHRLGTAEIESALVLQPEVAEAAVVGFPHDIKGEGIYAYVTLMQGQTADDRLQQQLVQAVRKEIGPIATIDHIHFTSALPKTRSGKIMRRILRKIAAGLPDEMGDISTLANPECVSALLE
ncbi:MAG: acetate--CoA ligase [Coxiellaceae bacterium]|nr:acetate--CoA ligase [Coxiellaceae bacterium]